ncbi:MAG: NADH-quinone oxidoreductase subunit NuoG [Nitrospinota bacterium]
MPTITINGEFETKTIEVQAGTTIIQAAERAGIDIPRFCYHPLLSIVGQCRVCLVEVEGVPKLQIACGTEVRDGMVVHTHSPRADKARRGILEFLLINHPLDCPVCDQGGECPLQDISYRYANAFTRFREPRRTYERVSLGHYIERDMNRCIHCTRCVRFTKEIDGGAELDFFKRSWETEVGGYQGVPPMVSIVSGNVIDICPVGALTDKKYRFKARVWEMRQTCTPCHLCSVGCRIQVWTRENRIMRCTAGANPAVNEEWICDVGRHGIAGIHAGERLSAPLLRRGDRLQPASWEEAIGFVTERLKAILEAHGPGAIGGIGGARSSNEAGYLFQKFFRAVIGTNNVDSRVHPRDHAQTEAQLWASGLTGWPSPLEELEGAEVVFLVGSGPFEEHPVLALRVRNPWRKRGAAVLSAGSRKISLHLPGMRELIHLPGAEAVFLRALSKALLEEGLAREEPEGFRDYKSSLEGESLPRLASFSGVAEEALRQAARALSGRKSGFIIGGPGLWDEGACRELLSLSLLTGLRACFVPAQPNLQGALEAGLHPALLPGFKPLSDGGARARFEAEWGCSLPPERGLSALEMFEALRGGKLKALYLMGSDPAAEFPDGLYIREALGRAELLVVQDVLPPASLDHAHVVLPAHGFPEKEATLTNFERRLQRGKPSLSCRGDAREDGQILAALARALGKPMRAAEEGKAEEQMSALIGLYGGASLRRLPQEGLRWKAEGRALSLMPSGPAAPPEEGPPGFPFRLIMGPLLHLSGAWGWWTERLKDMGEPRARMNPEDAEGLGVKDGEPVTLVSRGGRELRLPAEPDERVPSGRVFLPEAVVGKIEGTPVNHIYEGTRAFSWVNLRA